MAKYPSAHDKELHEALASLRDVREFTAFWRDLLTPAEIDELSRRFQVAKLLWTTKLSYLEISAKVGVSTTTVTRVAQWLYREGWKGYSLALKRKYGANQRE